MFDIWFVLDLLGFDKKKCWTGEERASKRLWNEFKEEESASGKEIVCKMNEKRLFTFFGCLYYFNGMILLFNVVNVKIEYVMNEIL